MIKNHATLPKYRTEIFLVLALPLLYFISRHNYNLFHSFADGVSIVIAACVFTIIWNGRRIVDNDYYLYVGIAFLFFAFWDLMHLLGNKNMGVFPKYGNLGPALYIVSRYILSISLLIAPLFINRKLNTTLMYAAYSLLTLLILLSIFYWNIFPICIVEGVGLTTFKVVSDYIICMILLGAIGLLLFNRRSFDSRVLRFIVSSVILSIATGLAFTLYADPFGIMNAIGHFFQIASFYMIYLAFIETSLTKPQDILYQKLKQNEERLAESVNQLNDVNAELKQEIAERKRAEEALRENEERFRLLFENMAEGVALHRLIYDKTGKTIDYRILNANHSYEKHTGISVEQARGFLASELYGTTNPPYLEEYTRVAHSGEPLSFQTYFPPLEKHFFISVIPHGRGQFATIFMDITERKKAEEKIKASLQEKEIMLKEIHHRVKNNLQVISSLLDMQSSYLQDEKAKEALWASMARVRTMAMIHTQLYQSQDLARVDFGHFIQDLISNIRQSYGRTTLTVEINVAVDDIRLGIETSIPCGLILNELVANALKHAFPEGKKGKINIRMRLEESRAVLTVQDNGVGFPESIDFRKTQSLGMELVTLLVGQINGTIDLQVVGGTIWTIRFSVKDEREWQNG
jgi:two-component sensor histidine kinase/PAS domain-containing protein